MAYGLTQSPLCVAATPSYFKTGSSPTGLSITGAITIEAWVKITSLPSDRADIVAHNSAAYKEYAMEIEKSGANYNLRLVRSYSGTPTTVATYTWNPSTATWYHIAIAHDPSGGGWEIVINGSSVATGSSTGTVDSTTSPVTIGVFEVPGTALAYDGRVSLVRIWNAKLSAATIAANMCNVYGTSTTNMQAEWSLDNVLTDASGNANTLTNVGSVVFASDVPATCSVVGPTNLKSLNTNVKANIKTINTNAIANVKSFNTNT